MSGIPLPIAIEWRTSLEVQFAPLADVFRLVGMKIGRQLLNSSACMLGL
jgi:hypothetical protein